MAGSQCGLLLHFYHPLMYWPAQAVATGTGVVGHAALAGRRLADLPDDVGRVGRVIVRGRFRGRWRGFLPAPGTLLRRIDMLRNSDGSTVRTSRWRTEWPYCWWLAERYLLAGFRPEPQQTAATATVAMGPVAMAIDWSSAIFGAVEELDGGAQREVARQSETDCPGVSKQSRHQHLFAGSAAGTGREDDLQLRNAILPLIGEEQLFAEDDRNQPWYSEHNRKASVKMPAILRHPADKADSTNAGYFLITGEHTAAGATQVPDDVQRHHRRGRSKDLLVVEASGKSRADSRTTCRIPQRLPCRSWAAGSTTGSFTVRW